jgi:hypothetical protein
MSLSWMFGFFRNSLLLAEASNKSHCLLSLQPIRLERAKHPLTNQWLHQATDTA